MSDEENRQDESPDTAHDDLGYRTLAQGFLSPRHRRLALMAAEGRSNQEIAEELGYVGSRVSILIKNPHIQQEITRLQERIFEETIGTRLKSFSDKALSVIERALNDSTNRIKESDKISLAQWVIEKIDGKATQKTDIGENLLSVLMDRLDSRGTATRGVSPTIDVTHSAHHTGQIEAKGATEVDDPLADWVRDFDAASS